MSPQLHLGEESYPLVPGQSVLESLEQAGVEVPSGCRSGTCTKCMLRADGTPPPASQRGLRPTLSAQGYFLACQAHPEQDLRLKALEDLTPLPTKVMRVDRVASDVCRLFLTRPAGLEYRAGQYIDVLHPDGESRSYSLASLPGDDHLELHVRQIPQGLMSQWLCEREAGQELRVRGPFGQCFHIADDPQRKLLLVGAGTGLSPLLGIARDALSQGHQGPIDLIHGGLEPDRLYLRDELAQLAEAHGQFRVHHCVLRGAGPREHEGPLDQVALRLAGPVESARAFLCGDDAIVKLLQRSLFLAGVPSGEIFADPFSPTKRASA